MCGHLWYGHRKNEGRFLPGRTVSDPVRRVRTGTAGAAVPQYIPRTGARLRKSLKIHGYYNTLHEPCQDKRRIFAPKVAYSGDFSHKKRDSRRNPGESVRRDRSPRRKTGFFGSCSLRARVPRPEPVRGGGGEKSRGKSTLLCGERGGGRRPGGRRTALSRTFGAVMRALTERFGN